MLTKYQIEEIKNSIIENIQPNKIILFGSYANGTADENSDLDILIVKDSNLPRYKRTPKLYNLLSKYYIDKDIFWYTEDEIGEWENVSLAFITKVIKTGKILYEVK